MAKQDNSEGLRERAEEFALELTETVRAVAGVQVSQFQALGTTRKDGSTRLAIRQGDMRGIELAVNGTAMLRLTVRMWCTWDHRASYLAVDESRVEVTTIAGSAEPIFRFEYLREPRGVPCAHLQVHAHRDAISYVLMSSGTGSTRGRRRQRTTRQGSRIPQLSDLHFPLGGHRFRPCLEDVLQMLIDDLGVDSEADAGEALREGRKRWRVRQLGAAVRDSPETAARVLQEIGYSVDRPADGPASDRLDRLEAF